MPKCGGFKVFSQIMEPRDRVELQAMIKFYMMHKYKEKFFKNLLQNSTIMLVIMILKHGVGIQVRQSHGPIIKLF